MKGMEVAQNEKIPVPADACESSPETCNMKVFHGKSGVAGRKPSRCWIGMHIRPVCIAVYSDITISIPNPQTRWEYKDFVEEVSHVSIDGQRAIEFKTDGSGMVPN